MVLTGVGQLELFVCAGAGDTSDESRLNFQSLCPGELWLGLRDVTRFGGKIRSRSA